jgi:predicted Fe-Mo cluster-binding NifX family protein
LVEIKISTGFYEQEIIPNRRKVMRIAVPTFDGKLCMHFGHCQHFTLVDVEDAEIKSVEATTPPPHAPGVLPTWLHEQGATIIIASGMGMRAQNLFTQNDIEVVVGASIMEPEELVKQYISGTLEAGDNICDH